MKPLDDESRRVIEAARGADRAAEGEEARIWNALSGRLDGPLSPAAAAASNALSGGGWLALFGAKAVIGTAIVGLSVGLALYSQSGPQRASDPEPRAPSAPPPSREAAPVPATGASDLAAEARVLAAAQRALNAAQPARALALLREHAQQFPAGSLAPEREAARVFALCALGRTGAARSAGQRFLQAWPESPLTERVRAGCAPSRAAR